MRAVVDGVDRPHAAQPTLSRLENSAEWGSIRLLEREGLEWFCRLGGTIDGRRRDSCEEIILDIDSSEDPTHGQQELAFFNGHYDSWMYHPLFIFEGGSGVLLASRLRPGNVGGVRQLLDILRPTVRRLKARFPKRGVAIRSDGDFAKAALLDDRIAKRARENDVVGRLCTAPGVGVVTAVALRAALDEAGRFRGAHQVESYMGLVPREMSSGEKQHRGRITKSGNARARWLLVGAAWAIRRSRTAQSAGMRTWAQRIEVRRGKRVATVALARKLAGILFAMWRDRACFERKISTVEPGRLRTVGVAPKAA
jgi:hypothetical protein